MPQNSQQNSKSSASDRVRVARGRLHARGKGARPVRRAADSSAALSTRPAPARRAFRPSHSVRRMRIGSCGTACRLRVVPWDKLQAAPHRITVVPRGGRAWERTAGRKRANERAWISPVIGWRQVIGGAVTVPPSLVPMRNPCGDTNGAGLAGRRARARNVHEALGVLGARFARSNLRVAGHHRVGRAAKLANVSESRQFRLE